MSEEDEIGRKLKDILDEIPIPGSLKEKLKEIQTQVDKSGIIDAARNDVNGIRKEMAKTTEAMLKLSETTKEMKKLNAYLEILIVELHDFNSSTKVIKRRMKKIDGSMKELVKATKTMEKLVSVMG